MHSSNDMMISAPKASSIPMTDSGVNISLSPFKSLRNSTPCSDDFAKALQGKDLKTTAIGQHRAMVLHEFVKATRRFDDLLAWLQVQVIGVGQHHARTQRVTSSGERHLTVALVPTGMNIGTSTVPCGVCKKP
jgi:hypothetical protein